jgi:hypothetical protein
MKIEIRNVDGFVFLNLTGENTTECAQLQSFIEQLNGERPLDKDQGLHNPVFDAALRIESVGFNDAGDIESVAIEGSQ